MESYRRRTGSPVQPVSDRQGDSLWWAIVTMSTVGYGDKVPLSRAGKFMAIIWIFSSIILVALFTAKASSIFTVTDMELKIHTESDLRNARVGAVVSNVPFIQYLKHNVYKEQIQVSPSYLLKYNMGMALPPGSQLKEPINRILLQKVSEPNWKSMLEKYLGEYQSFNYPFAFNDRLS